MEWLDRLNDALDYIEENLAGEINYEKAAQLACCSTYHFQRMFSYIAEVSMSEYIRRRRMTYAAFDLQKGDKVIDVALRYGYESPTSFNRAFQNLHGITPSAAQKENAALKAFPKISFKITIKGDVEMDYRIVKKDGFRIVGVKIPLAKSMEENSKAVPEMWDKVAQDGTLEKICSLMNKEPMGILGVSVCMSSMENWEYYMAAANDDKAPEGMSEYNIGANTWAIFSGEGAMPKAMQEMHNCIFTEWLPTSGYEYADAPDIELYMNADMTNAKFEIWLPITKK